MRPHHRLLVLLAAIAAMSWGLVPIASAETVDQASVRVTVTGPGGAPLEGVDSLRVTLYPVPTSDYFWEEEVDPGEPATFTDLSGGGDYRVVVSPRGGRYVRGEQVIRTADSGTTEVAVELEIGGFVSGTVRQPDGSVPEGITQGGVVLERQAEPGGPFVGYDSPFVRPDGTYEVAVAEPGTYRVAYTSLYDDYWARSEPLSLTRDSVETADLVAQRSASVGGTLELQDEPAGELTIQVAAYELVDGQWSFVNGSRVDLRSGPYEVFLAGPEDREIRLGVTDYSGYYAPAFWDGTTFGASDIEDATTITVPAGGSVTDRDFTLRRKDAQPETITNTAPPQVSGVAKAGETLTATPGAWSVEDPDVALQWRRDGVDIPAATGSTYALTVADVGQSITVAAVASKSGYASSAEAVSAPVGPVAAAPALAKPSFLVLPFPGKAKVSFVSLIWAAGVPASKVDGRLAVLLDGKQVATTSVRNGLAAVEVTGQAKGTRTYTLAYSGNAVVQAGSKTVKVTIK